MTSNRYEFMNNAYGPSFAKIYNRMWTDFADRVAPRVMAFYEETAAGQKKLPVLDLACGTGTLALHFLAAGYPVTGVDLSPAMLAYARENAREFIEAKQANFLEADVVDFKLRTRFGLAVSTYDALNHLENTAALKKCFTRTAAALLPGGYFIFDLNTRLGLQNWDGIAVHDSVSSLIVKRGGFDHKTNRAFYKISGFLKGDDGRYERFEEMVVETMFELAEVARLLKKAGFSQVHAARETELTQALAAPEEEDRVFIVARKAGRGR